MISVFFSVQYFCSSKRAAFYKSTLVCDWYYYRRGFHPTDCTVPYKYRIMVERKIALHTPSGEFLINNNISNFVIDNISISSSWFSGEWGRQGANAELFPNLLPFCSFAPPLLWRKSVGNSSQDVCYLCLECYTVCDLLKRRGHYQHTRSRKKNKTQGT